MRLPVSSQLPAALLFYFAASLCAQIANPAVAPPQAALAAPRIQELSQGFSFASDATEGLIKLDVVVTDKSGKPITGLGSTDFTLTENSRPNNILSFHAFDGTSAVPDPPVEVILLIDTLNLPDSLASQERREVERFLRQNNGELAQPTAIFGLSEGGARWVAQSSRNGNDLAAAIAKNKELALIRPLRSSPGAAYIGIGDPTSLTALKVLGDIATAERRVPDRKLLVWVGPGWGIGSGAYREEYLGTEKLRQNLFDRIYWFSTLLREARVTLYSLSVGETTPASQFYLNYLKWGSCLSTVTPTGCGFPSGREIATAYTESVG
jgi:VWFA-related protein